MAYPVYEGNGGIFAAGDYSITCNYPVAVDVNDIAWVQLLDADNDTFTVPEGWNLVDEDGSVTFASTCWMWRRCDGTEGGTSQTFISQLGAGAGVYGVISIFSGCRTSGVPYEGKAMTAVSQGASAAILACETLGVERLVCVFINVEDNVSVGVGSGYAEDYELQSTFGGDACLELQSQQVATAQTIEATSAALGGNDYNGVLVVAFKPVGANWSNKWIKQNNIGKANKIEIGNIKSILHIE